MMNNIDQSTEAIKAPDWIKNLTWSDFEKKYSEVNGEETIPESLLQNLKDLLASNSTSTERDRCKLIYEKQIKFDEFFLLMRILKDLILEDKKESKHLNGFEKSLDYEKELKAIHKKLYGEDIPKHLLKRIRIDMVNLST